MTDEKTTINTGGGAATNDVSTGGGDFVGRDKNINLILAGWSWDRVIEQLLTSNEARGVTPQKTQWQAWNWQEAAAKYHQSLIELYSTIRVLGKSSPVPLEGIFTDVYVLDEVTARLRYDVRRLREQPIEQMDNLRLPHERQRRVAGLEQVKQGKNLFILGKPGAGKTTFLKYITLQAAKGELKKTPIFVSLHEWAQWITSHERTLFGFLVHQFSICNIPAAQLFIEQLLQSRQAIVLFDGLDEVRQEGQQRADLTRLLNDFAKQYRHCQCLITCRIAASEHLFDGFQDVEVADFYNAQVESYAHKWFGQDETKFKAFITDLEKTENKGIRELCSTPLLLSMLCLAFDDTMHFPPQRSELYERALDVLLNKWDSSRSIQRDEIYKGLSPKRKQQLFAHIAAPTFEKGEYFLGKYRLAALIVDYLRKVPDAPAAEDIDGEAVLKAIEAQHSIFVERAQDVYSFSHLTFQEYFTAKYIVENEVRGTTNALIRNHLTDDRWREIFLLTASMLDNADTFFDTFRHAIHVLVNNDTTLIALLTWAEKKATTPATSAARRSTVRLAYIGLDRSLASALDSSLTRDLAGTFNLELARTLALNLDLAIKLARDLHLTQLRARTLASDRRQGFGVVLNYEIESVLERYQARDLAHDLANTYGFNLGLDFGLLYAWQIARIFEYISDFNGIQEYIISYAEYFEEILRLSHQAQATGLTTALGEMTVPGIGANRVWWAFADRLLGLMRHERTLGRLRDLSQRHVDNLNTYLRANELLMQCLKLAVVSDRRAIEDSLLLPPQTTTD